MTSLDETAYTVVPPPVMIEKHTGDGDDDLEESGHTVGPPTDDPELLEQFDGNLQDADESASQVHESESRSFQEALELLPRVKRARGLHPSCWHWRF